MHENSSQPIEHEGVVGFAQISFVYDRAQVDPKMVLSRALKMRRSVRSALKPNEIMMIELGLVKWCPGCTCARSSAFFGKDATRADGLRGMCRECTKARARARYEAQQEVE